ncbi:MAG: inositol monophosphatase family protein [Dehalococcoidia bacterium]|nr:histidinol phosphate phosphatase [Dehalococcoidia bacterium]
MTPDPELGALLAIALHAADIARDVIMPLYESGVGVELKSDGTPVTDADRRAEAAIREFLARECPDHSVLGEEYGESAGSSMYRWLLDPIDGTKSFIHHVPLFGTLIALERAGDPVVGVIACHALNETASAAAGHGAHLNGRPIRVSRVTSVAEATVLTTSIQGMQIALGDGLDAFLPQPMLLRTWGDCYGYLQVACGRADAMLDPVMNSWDAAALFPIIREAGGTITTWDGQPVVGDSVAASNGALHAELLNLLRPDPPVS